MIGRIIETDDCILEGIAWLSAAHPEFKAAYDLTGPLPLRRTKDGFDRLLSAIVSQQVSVAAASAIWSRVEAAGMTDPDNVLNATEDDLRALGMSRQKVRYAKALAGAGIDFNNLRQLPDLEIIKELTAVNGIGVWTAEIYAMFALGRADVFAPGDLALQEAARMLFNLDARPTERALRKMAEDWSPWRAVAARLLWAYYKVAKDREGIL